MAAEKLLLQEKAALGVCMLPNAGMEMENLLPFTTIYIRYNVIIRVVSDNLFCYQDTNLPVA